MDHWHTGDRAHMPLFMDKLRQSVTAAEQQGVEVSIRPGAGDVYEDRFSRYWLVTAWSVFAFNVLAMVVVIVHMSSGAFQYQWLPHLAGTAIIDAGIAFMALIYRFVLFPAPLYQQRTMPTDMLGMPGYGPMFGHVPTYPQPPSNHHNYSPSQPTPFTTSNAPQSGGVGHTGPGSTGGNVSNGSKGVSAQ